MPHRRICARLRIAAIALAIAGVSAEVRAGTFVVDRQDDDGSPAAQGCDDAVDDDCSLRGALAAAAARPAEEVSTIRVPAGTYRLTASSFCGPFRLAGDAVPFSLGAAVSSLCISRGDVSIVGAGAAATVIDGGGTRRPLLIGADAVVHLAGLAVGHGFATRDFSGNLLPNGGGIHNHGTLTLTDVVVRDNALPIDAGGADGAGIYNGGALTLVRAIVRDNDGHANNAGGGIYNDGSRGATSSLSDSTISGNAIGASGGGLANDGGHVVVTGSTVSGNTAGRGGGGISNLGSGGDASALTVINGTISGNTAGTVGGGIANQRADLRLESTTIADNTCAAAGSGGGGGVSNLVGAGTTVAILNTLIAGNHDPAAVSPVRPDCFVADPSYPIASLGFNLIGDPTGCALAGDLATTRIGIDPLLGPLADNGGGTRTHALLPDSPALDAGRPVPSPGSGGDACPATDQRGFLRPLGAACDIGAYEAAQDRATLRVRPDAGGNGGVVSVLIFGAPGGAGTGVRLRRAGESDIEGEAVGWGSAAILATRFDLVGRSPGAWDVVVVRPDGGETVLPNGFTVESGGAPELWTDVTGPRLIRFTRPARFTVFYGNRGNVDAVGVPLSLSIPAGYRVGVYFPIVPPPAQPGQWRSDWSQVPVTVTTDGDGRFLNVPLLLPLVPAGSAGSLQIELTAPLDSQDSLLLAALGTPLFAPELDPAAVVQAVAGTEAYLSGQGVTLPPSLAPILERYFAEEMALTVVRARADFAASLGARLPVYSMSQLQLDLVFHGGGLATSTHAARLTGIVDWLAAAVAPNPGWGQSQNSGTSICTGGILAEGQSCTPPDKIYPPDIPPPPGCNLRDPSTFGNCQPTEDHCGALGTHHVEQRAGGSFCVPDRRPKGCPGINIDNPLLGSGNAQCKTWPLKPASSKDPNDKVGPLGRRAAQLVPREELLSYTVQFENVATAALPAQEVLITDRLDATRLDLDTLSLGAIAFGDIVVQPAAGVQEFTGSVDLRPAQNLVVAIRVALDRATGTLTWRFLSVDPATGQQTDDPLAGFLPPNAVAPDGEGNVAFTVRPRPEVPYGEQICNGASIVFDTNPPLETPIWCNTLGVAVDCTGDCDGDDAVTIDELVVGVAIALGRLPTGNCPALDTDADGQVAINELIAAVNTALRGCAA